MSPGVLSGRVREVLDCDVRDDLRRTTVPLLYLEASDDRLLSVVQRGVFSHQAGCFIQISSRAPLALATRAAESRKHRDGVRG